MKQRSSRLTSELSRPHRGWFVLNARDARWFEKPGLGFSLALTGEDEHEAETFFPMRGMSIRVMNPGEPSTT